MTDSTLKKVNVIKAIGYCYHWTHADIAALLDVTTTTVGNWSRQGLPNKLTVEMFELLLRLHDRAEMAGRDDEIRAKMTAAARQGPVALIVRAHAELQALEGR